MINAIVHLANKDFPSLVDDFIDLEILPRGRVAGDRRAVDGQGPVAVYCGRRREEVRRKGAGAYGIDADADLGAPVGGFQAMTQDALTVLNDVPFSIPPYFALLGRAFVTLEGIALQGDPDYAIIQAAYPFVSRKLLVPDRPAARRALQEALYAGAGRDDGSRRALSPRRLASLVSSALDETGEDTIVKGGSIDFDAIGEDANATTLAKYVLSDRGSAIRDFCEDEAVVVADALGRQAARRRSTARRARPAWRSRRLPFVGARLEKALPDPATTPAPLLLPGDGAPRLSLRVAARSARRRGPSIEPRRRALRPGRDEAARGRRAGRRGPGHPRDAAGRRQRRARGPSRPRGRFWTSRRRRRKSRTTGASTRCWTPPRRRSDGGTRTPSRSCTSRRSSTTRSARGARQGAQADGATFSSMPVRGPRRDAGQERFVVVRGQAAVTPPRARGEHRPPSPRVLLEVERADFGLLFREMDAFVVHGELTTVAAHAPSPPR